MNISRRAFTGGILTAPAVILAQEPQDHPQRRRNSIDQAVLNTCIEVNNNISNHRGSSHDVRSLATALRFYYASLEDGGLIEAMQHNVALLPDEFPAEWVEKMQQASAIIAPPYVRLQAPSREQIVGMKSFIAQNGIAGFHAAVVKSAHGFADHVRDQRGDFIPADFNFNRKTGCGTADAFVGGTFLAGVVVGTLTAVFCPLCITMLFAESATTAWMVAGTAWVGGAMAVGSMCQ